jgi:hypothetical protein
MWFRADPGDWRKIHIFLDKDNVLLQVHWKLFIKIRKISLLKIGGNNKDYPLSFFNATMELFNMMIQHNKIKILSIDYMGRTYSTQI